MIQEWFRVLNSREVQVSQSGKAGFSGFRFAGDGPEVTGNQREGCCLAESQFLSPCSERLPMMFAKGNQDAEA